MNFCLGLFTLMFRHVCLDNFEAISNQDLWGSSTHVHMQLYMDICHIKLATFYNVFRRENA